MIQKHYITSLAPTRTPSYALGAPLRALRQLRHQHPPQVIGALPTALLAIGTHPPNFGTHPPTDDDVELPEQLALRGRCAGCSAAAAAFRLRRGISDSQSTTPAVGRQVQFGLRGWC